MNATPRQLLLLGVTLCGVLGTGTAATSAAEPATSHAPAVHHACQAPTTRREAQCFAEYRSGHQATPATAAGERTPSAPAGYGPSDLRSAYALPAAGGSGQVVAVITAYDDPSADADLAVYRAQYGLPPCTLADGCLREVNQRGDAAPLPEPDAGWSTETDLDLQMVSAACPNCSLLLVEAESSLIPDLAVAANHAAHLGADVITNSYGVTEYHGVLRLGARYRHPGVTVVAATGDFGFSPSSFPADLTSTIAVGGTRLTHTASGWHQRAWSGSSSGCSGYVSKPAWQRDHHCDMRVDADLSAVADPDTGPAFYDTYGLGGDGGWMIGGGTSAAAPLIAGMIGLAGHGGQIDPRYLYQHRDGFTDVIGGSNGFCGGDYLCTAKEGYDAPTGLGTPLGLTAFGEPDPTDFVHGRTPQPHGHGRSRPLG